MHATAGEARVPAAPRVVAGFVADKANQILGLTGELR